MDRTFEILLAEQCAPTLAGLKPASLFRWRNPDPDLALYWARQLAPFGLGLRLIHAGPRAALVYVYRGRWLRRILSDPENAAFLRRYGYQPERGSGFLLRQLDRRLSLSPDFPHEIGIFLGYPLEDVTGFIENHGQNYTCLGCWKAYGDPRAAGERFDRFRRCTAAYRKNVGLGIPITRLIIAA